MSLQVTTYDRGPILFPAQPYDYIYSTTADQKYEVGAILETAKGRRFRYSKNGALTGVAGGSSLALTQCLMTQASIPIAKHISIAQTAYAKAAGLTDVTVLVTTGGIAAVEPWCFENALAGGTMVCSDTSPAVIGDTYEILASRMIDETHINLILASPIRNAIAATGGITLAMNPWMRVTITIATTSTARSTGVPLCPVPAGNWFWAQTKGVCPMIVDTGDTLVIGALAGMPSTDAVAGTVGAATATGYAFPIYGRVLYVGAADEVALIDLMLE